MATPDPPPNSLGLDLVRPEPAEPALDPQSSSPSLASPSIPQPAIQPTDNTDTTADSDTTAAAAAATTTPTTGVTKVEDLVEDVAKSNVSKKSPYVNPERVKTGGLPKVENFSLALCLRILSFYRISGQINGRGTRGEDGSNAGTERKNQAEKTRALSHITLWQAPHT
jgi:hypothetical protein